MSFFRFASLSSVAILRTHRTIFCTRLAHLPPLLQQLPPSLVHPELEPVAEAPPQAAVRPDHHCVADLLLRRHILDPVEEDLLEEATFEPRRGVQQNALVLVTVS